MRRAWTLAVGVLLAMAIGSMAMVACSTPEQCDRACDAWAQNGCWSYDTCYSECRIEGDWSEDYVQCCEDHAGDCADLENICG